MKNQPRGNAGSGTPESPQFDRRFLFDDDDGSLSAQNPSPVNPFADSDEEIIPQPIEQPVKPRRVGQYIPPKAAPEPAAPVSEDASDSEDNASESRATVYRWVDDEDIVFTSSHDSDSPYDDIEGDDEDASSDASGRKRRWPWIVSGAAALCVFLYCFVVFFPTPFVKKWRNIWIETAMSTMTHQWLATAFFPQSLIDEILTARYEMQEAQKDMVSDNELVSTTTAASLGTLRAAETTKNISIQNTDVATSKDSGSSTAETTGTAVETTSANSEQASKIANEWLNPEHPLYQIYPEIDMQSFYEYVLKHGDDIYDKDGYLVIDAADRNSKGTSIKTTNGDTIKAIDTRNGIIIASVSGDGYKGLIAIVRNPAQVGLAVSKNYGSSGQRIGTLCSQNNAVLGINASGFVDPDGNGNGGEAYGYVLSGSKEYHAAQNSSWFVMGFNKNNVFSICSTQKFNSSTANLRDAMEFQPLLINNGKIVCTVNDGWGVNPRSGIGQCADGSVLLVVIDGRSTTSLGCRGIDLANIFYKYGAVQAANVDGGSSSVMYYNGRVISNPSGQNKTDGRSLPDAWVVYRAK